MTTVAIMGVGGMGAAVAEVLQAAGMKVVTSLAGRSRESQARAADAGIADVGDAGVCGADFILSIVPPDRALGVAERLAATLASSSRKPVFVDCNATSPATVRTIEGAVMAAGTPFVDGGIIGMPPRAGYVGPTIFVSGGEAPLCAALRCDGLKFAVMSGPVGAASALKMSYAGITKGLIGLAATMALAAERGGVGLDLANELQNSQTDLFASFSRSVPDMLPKARRWVPEMREIAGFVGSGRPEHEIYEGFAALYQSIADDAEAVNSLRRFFSASSQTS